MKEELSLEVYFAFKATLCRSRRISLLSTAPAGVVWCDHCSVIERVWLTNTTLRHTLVLPGRISSSINTIISACS